MDKSVIWYFTRCHDLVFIFTYGEIRFEYTLYEPQKLKYLYTYSNYISLFDSQGKSCPKEGIFYLSSSFSEMFNIAYNQATKDPRFTTNSKYEDDCDCELCLQQEENNQNHIYCLCQLCIQEQYKLDSDKYKKAEKEFEELKNN